MAETFMAFYTTRPFWALSAIDLKMQDLHAHFHKMMSEVAYLRSTDTFSLRVCRDGLLMLQIAGLESTKPDPNKHDIHALVEWWGEYLEYCNCLYLLLDSAVMQEMNLAYFDFSEVTNKDAFRISFEGGQQQGGALPTESLATTYLMARLVGTHSLPLDVDPMLAMRQVLSKEALESAGKSLDVVLGQKALVPMLSGIGKALSQYKIGNYTISLTLAWFVIELVLNLRWAEFLKAKNRIQPDGRKRINEGRKNKLLTGRDYPVSVTSNILELVDVLGFDLFEKIDAVRGFRNNAIHQDPRYVCTPDDCVMAMKVAKELVLEGIPLSLELNFSFSVRGA